NGHGVVVGLTDLAEDDTQQVLVRLAVGGHRDGATVELLDGVVTYVDARTSATMERRTFVSARATSHAEALAKGVNLDVSVAAARATTAAATLQIVSMARAGDLAGAETLPHRPPGHGRALTDDMPDFELSRLLDDLVELRPTLAGLAPQPVAHAHRAQKANHAQPRPAVAGELDAAPTPASA